MSKIQETGDKVLANVERVIVGKHHEVRLALVALLCRGHLLIEDVPGTGKTVLAKAIARSLGGSFRRIQFTPDLLPSDVSGLSIYNQKTQEFEFRPGPDLQPGRARRRDQPGDAQDAVRAARVHGGAPGDDRRHDLPRCPIRSSSSPPRTRSSTRAPSRCPRPSSTGSCSASASATRSRSRRSSSSTSRSGRTRSTTSRRSCRSRSCARCRPRSARSTSTRPCRTTSSAWSTARGTTPTSTSAPRRADRSRSTARARRWPACSAATTSSRTTSRRWPSRPWPTA